MILKKIQLLYFRNFAEESFEIGYPLTMIMGENSQGKTNLLEAVYFILTGSGFREEKEEELIRFEENRTKVWAQFEDKSHVFEFEAMLQKKRTLTEKTFFIDKTVKKHFSYEKELPGAVLFTPEQISIIDGPPQVRRLYFNKLIAYFDYEYKKRINNYENALRRRNKILEKKFASAELEEELGFWNEYLEKQANYINKARGQYVDFLNNKPDLDSKKFRVEYIKNIFTVKKAQTLIDEERRLRKTAIGPQKDDFAIYISSERGEKNVHHFGSRSEERLAIFWLKLNELSYFERYRKKPILLLDDIFSELDKTNKKIVLGLLNRYQTLATTTENNLLTGIKTKKEIIKL